MSKNKFSYKTNGEQNRQDLRKQLNAILEKLINQDYINKETGLVASFSKKEINKIGSNKAISKSIKNGIFKQEEHFKVAEDLGKLYENANLKATHLDKRERPNIANVHRFHIDIEVNNKQADAKITVFEKFKGKNRIYTIELMGLNPLLYSPSVQGTEVAESLSSESAAHIDDSNITNPDSETIPHSTLNNAESTKELESQVQELTQITIDTADIAPKASAMLANAYDKCGENALANTLINTISADDKVMQSVQREFENLIQQESEQSTQSVDEVAQTQQELDEAQILQQGEDSTQMILGDEIGKIKGPKL